MDFESSEEINIPDHQMASWEPVHMMAWEVNRVVISSHILGLSENTYLYDKCKFHTIRAWHFGLVLNTDKANKYRSKSDAFLLNDSDLTF